jgi:hypothetical protein
VLLLEDNGVKISPIRADWKCTTTGDTLADKTGPGTSASLWVNLSDGFIGGGRKNFDGSGGESFSPSFLDTVKALCSGSLFCRDLVADSLDACLNDAQGTTLRSITTQR